MARTRKITRSTQLGGDEKVRKQLLKTFDKVSEGYNAQVDRSDDTLDMWDIQNCKLGAKQFYAGNSRIFRPLVHNAIKARKTRAMSQLFPQAGRYIDVTTEDGEIPHAEMALLELYCDRAELRTKVVPALLVAGDVEGQYTVCVTWGTKKRHTVSRETSPIRIGGIDHPDLGETEKITEREDDDSGPEIDIVPDPDFLVLPATAETIDEALDVGGSVTQLVRWSQERVQQAIDSGEIDEEAGKQYGLMMADENYAEQIINSNRVGDDQGHRDVAKRLAEEAGIKLKGKVAHIYRTWTKVEVGGEKRLLLAYYGGDQIVLGARLCPYWNDKCDYVSRPVEKMPGVFKGPSLVKPVADQQYKANDFENMGTDSGLFSMMPVIMTDPVKNPKIGSMVLDLMSVWEVSPKDTQVLTFPALYQHAINIIGDAERIINQTLSVTPGMVAQSTGVPGRKRNQAEVALEQQAELMNTDDMGVVIEAVLSEVLERMADYDAQFRDNEMVVRSVGELGVKAEMVTVPPGQMGKRWQYKWRGIAAKNAVQQIQQQISALNVIDNVTKSNPAVAQAGYRVNPVPLLKTVAENAFGPNMAPQIFASIRDEYSLDPEFENQMMAEGLLPMVHQPDNDPQHMQAHQAWFQQGGYDPMSPQAAEYRHHMMAHQQQMQAKQAAQMAAQQQMQGGGLPQVAGPRPGGQPAPPRGNVQQPPGRIAPDQMRGGLVQFPRRT